MSETPLRRSSRAGSRQPSATPAPQTEATPGARARGRPRKSSASPLPGIATGLNIAYGAQGKADLGTQLASGNSDDMASRLNSARNNAITRDDDDDDDDDNQIDNDVAQEGATRPFGGITTTKARSSTRASSVASSTTKITRRTSRYSQVQEPIQEEDDEEDDEELASPFPPSGRAVRNRVGTTSPHALSRSFGPVGESSLTHNDNSASVDDPDAQILHEIAASVVPPATASEIRAARPWSLTVLKEATMRWLGIIFGPYMRLGPRQKNLAVFLSLLLLSFFTLAPVGKIYRGLDTSISRWASNGLDLASNGLDFVQGHAAKANEAAQHQFYYDRELTKRVSGIEHDLGVLKTQYAESRESIDNLTKILPEHIVVQKDEATGAWELPAAFWSALHQQLADDPKLAYGRNTAWEDYVKNNRASLQKTLKKDADQAVESSIKASKHIISKDMVIQLVKDHALQYDTQLEGRMREEMRQHMTEQMSTLKTSMTAEYRVIAEDAAFKTVSRQYARRDGLNFLEDVSMQNMARNQELNLRTINYFSGPLGAVVDPYLTSPTHKLAQPNILASTFAWAFLRRPHPPAMALERWDEVTDCWCAAASTSINTTTGKPDVGKAQIGVIMPRAIEVQSITIEHIPARGTLDIGNAPRHIEVFAYAPQIDLSRPAVVAMLPKCRSSAPAAGYVCIGNGNYDLHGENHVQNIPLVGGIQVGLVNKVVVRAVSNWGQDWTCFYRLRMHGENEIQVEAGKKAGVKKGIKWDIITGGIIF